MRRKIIFLSVFLFSPFFFNPCASAQDETSGYGARTETQGDRYVLVTLTKAGSYGYGAGGYVGGGRTTQRKMPAVVLDSYLGIVWRCQDIEDERPLWIKTDLAKNSEQQLTKKNM